MIILIEGALLQGGRSFIKTYCSIKSTSETNIKE